MKAHIMAVFLMAVAPAFAGAAETPAPVSATAEAEIKWDRIVLKDGQSMQGRIKGYDAFFLDVEAKGSGAAFHLPWREVAEVAPAEFTGDTAMIRQYLSPDMVKVESSIQARDPYEAVSKSFWPGFLIHGYGHKVAGDQDTFLSLAGAEIFGALVAGFGAAKLADAGVAQGDKDTAQYLVYGGGAMFVLSWAWDVLGSARAARKYNERHRLILGAAPGGVVLGLAGEF